MDWNTVEFARDPRKAFQICILPNFIEYITQRLPGRSLNLSKANVDIKKGERILLILSVFIFSRDLPLSISGNGVSDTRTV